MKFMVVSINSGFVDTCTANPFAGLFFFFNKNTFLHVFAFICYLLVSTYNRDKVKYFFILLKINENQKTWKSLMSSCKI